jgi:DNA-binding CsgD family transcriptional regulator
MDLSLNDISGVIRLVREVCDRWDDPRSWREHFLRGACTLLNGTVGMMLGDHDGRRGAFGDLAILSSVGVPEPMRPLVGPAIARIAHRDYADVSANVLPGLDTLWDHMQRQGWVTTMRAQLTDAAADHAAPHYRDFRRRLDCDDYVVSIRVVDLPRRPEAISIDRPHGAPPFGPREVTLLKLLHDEIAPLIGVRLATEDHLSRDGLSKRLRETLSLLLDGLSEKQVAASLGLGARTVHEYVTMIYKHFDVSSRAELLAYFVRRAPVRRRPAARVVTSKASVRA